jgi:hypothetical protein
MVHAALLLLMLEAVHTDLVFTISLKRSTQNLQLSTSSPADYPSFEGKADVAFVTRASFPQGVTAPRIRTGRHAKSLITASAIAPAAWRCCWQSCALHPYDLASTHVTH